MNALQKNFWKHKTLEQMSSNEWEALCDRCGRCCVLKYEDAESGEVSYTNIACRYLDTRSCRCRCYAERREKMPDCALLTPDMVRDCNWLPDSCSYLRLAKDEMLPSWHPLITGDARSTVSAGMSVHDKVVTEDEVEHFEDFLSA